MILLLSTTRHHYPTTWLTKYISRTSSILFAHALPISTTTTTGTSSNVSSFTNYYTYLLQRRRENTRPWLIQPMFGRHTHTMMIRPSTHLRGGGGGTTTSSRTELFSTSSSVTDDEALSSSFDFDYLVIGAGSGGIASAR